MAGINRAIVIGLAPLIEAEPEQAEPEPPSPELSPSSLPMPQAADVAEPPAMDAPSPDSFGNLMTLLALVADAPASRARLLELRAQLDAVAKASARLAADRVAFDEHAQRIRADLEAKTSELRKRQVKLRGDQGQLAAQQEVISRQKAALDAREGVGLVEVGAPGGLTRESDRAGWMR
jgi:hypothetical protein